MEVIARDNPGFGHNTNTVLSPSGGPLTKKHLQENSDRIYLYQDILQNLVIDIPQQSSVITPQIHVHMTNIDSSL